MPTSIFRLNNAFARLGRLRAALHEGQMTLEALDGETMPLGAFDDEVSNLRTQLLDIVTSASGIWGMDANWQYDLDFINSEQPNFLEPLEIDVLINHARHQIAVASKILEHDMQLQAIGAWIGAFPLSSETVSRARGGFGRNGEPSLEITFRDSFAKLFRSHSARFVPSSHEMHLRLEGDIILRSRVYEPLDQLSVIGIDNARIACLIQSMTTAQTKR